MRRPLREGVGRNIYQQSRPVLAYCRPLREGVGRNFKIVWQTGHRLSVALYARAWVEIFRRDAFMATYEVALYARAWVEINYTIFARILQVWPSSRGRG